MGCRIFVGSESPTNHVAPEQAILFDSVSGWAFGPLFDECGHADAFSSALCFENWLDVDARTLPQTDLEKKYDEWLDVTGLRFETGDDKCAICDGGGI